MAKRFLRKFIEEVEPAAPSRDFSAYSDSIPEYQPFDLDNFSGLDDLKDFNDEDVAVPVSELDNIIDETYSENGLADKSKSVYMVEIYMETLPPETLSEVKSMTVRKILNASGISEEDVISDGKERRNILEAVSRKIAGSNDEKITGASEQIEALKEQIAELNKIIQDSKNENKQVSAIINTEIEKINSLEAFIKLSGGN